LRILLALSAVSASLPDDLREDATPDVAK